MTNLRDPLCLVESDGTAPDTIDPIYSDPGVLKALQEIDDDCTGIITPEELSAALSAGSAGDGRDIQLMQEIDRR